MLLCRDSQIKKFIQNGVRQSTYIPTQDTRKIRLSTYTPRGQKPVPAWLQGRVSPTSVPESCCSVSCLPLYQVEPCACARTIARLKDRFLAAVYAAGF